MNGRNLANNPKLTSREEFAFLTGVILKHAGGDHTFVALRDESAGTTRFANNQVVQNVNVRRLSLSVSAAFGRRHGTAGTTDLSVGAVRETLRRAEAIAQAAPEDPEYLGPVPLQTYRTLPTWRAETAEAGPERRLADARRAIALCRADGCRAAGIVASSVSVAAVAADTGLMAYEERTEAEFSVTATAANSTGRAGQEHRSIDRLGVEERTRVAIEKARRSADAREVPPGRYTVVLEPAAVAGLMAGLLWRLDAKAYYKGTSPFAGKLGRPIVDGRLTLRNDPGHLDLCGVGFTSLGLPTNDRAWIARGALAELDYDRFTARQHQVDTIATLDAPILAGEGPAGDRVEDLIRGTQRGILVTTIWYIRTVNPNDLTLTGMTRDGTFLIQDGEITTPVHNLRFHESPLRAFNQLDAFTEPAEAVSTESGKMLLPALRIRDFNFSSVTKF
jgi:predicted Zn-dependent protease